MFVKGMRPKTSFATAIVEDKDGRRNEPAIVCIHVDVSFKVWLIISTYLQTLSNTKGKSTPLISSQKFVYKHVCYVFSWLRTIVEQVSLSVFNYLLWHISTLYHLEAEQKN